MLSHIQNFIEAGDYKINEIQWGLINCQAFLVDMTMHRMDWNYQTKQTILVIENYLKISVTKSRQSSVNLYITSIIATLTVFIHKVLWQAKLTSPNNTAGPDANSKHLNLTDCSSCWSSLICVIRTSFFLWHCLDIFNSISQIFLDLIVVI